MTFIHNTTNASYNFKAPNVAGDADSKVEVTFPSVESQTPDYAAIIAIAVAAMNTHVAVSLTGNATINATVDSEVTKNAEMLLVLTADSSARTVTLGDAITGDAIVVPANTTVNAFLKYDGTNFLLVTSTKDDVQDGSIVAAKLATDAVETLKIKDANVTHAKLADDAVETNNIKDANVTLAKLAAGVAAGDIMWYNGTSWVILPKGTDGQVLKMVSGSPAWAADLIE